MKYDHLIKNIFYITLFSGCYFLLAFTHVLQQIGSRIVGALFELLTIPLIVFNIGTFVFLLYLLLIKHSKLNIYILASLLISAAVITALFLVK